MKKYSLIALAALMVFSLASCLKDKNVEDQVYGMKGVGDVTFIEIPAAAANLNQPFGLKFNTDTVTDYQVTVNVTSAPLDHDVTATIGIDQAYVDELNAAGSGDPDFRPFELFPDSLWSIAATDLTVPAGQNKASAALTIHAEKMEGGHNYTLPFTITNSSLPVNNWKHLFIRLISSPYSGVFGGYHVNIVHNGALVDDFSDGTMELSTIDEKTVSQPGSIGDYFGGYTEYHFNSNGTVSVKAGTGAGDPSAYGANVLESHYDVATGTFYVKFTILSGSYIFTETFDR
jgi:hypothetical protein